MSASAAELGAVKVHISGHVYLDLKDEKACIAGVMWRMSARAHAFKPEMGMEVIATGKITTYPGRSNTSSSSRRLSRPGVGALLAQLEERKRRSQRRACSIPRASSSCPTCLM